MAVRRRSTTRSDLFTNNTFVTQRTGRNPRVSDYPVSDRVLDAFRNFVKADSESGLTTAQVEGELDFVKLRLREEIITAGFGSDIGTRILLDADPQVLRAVEALPNAK